MGLSVDLTLFARRAWNTLFHHSSWSSPFMLLSIVFKLEFLNSVLLAMFGCPTVSALLQMGCFGLSSSFLLLTRILPLLKLLSLPFSPRQFSLFLSLTFSFFFPLLLCWLGSNCFLFQSDLLVCFCRCLTCVQIFDKICISPINRLCCVLIFCTSHSIVPFL